MIAQNVSEVRRRVTEACLRGGRDPSGVTLICVSKGRDIGEVREALDAGIRDIGESRLQEALPKHRELSGGAAARWHLIGHLQTNKVRDAVEIFDLIHSVDSARLAREIDRQARRAGKAQEILVEVNVSGEPSKYGVEARELPALAREIAGLANVRLKGLMTIAPYSPEPEDSRPWFRRLRGLCAELEESGSIARPGILSMGMSGDYVTAVEEGATMIRVGRALFEG